MVDDLIKLDMAIHVDPGSVVRIRPSKAQLRKALKNKRLSRRERIEAYSFLQYRRKWGIR